MDGQMTRKMLRSGALFSLSLLMTVSTLLHAQTASSDLASTPPMGWNSWDSYGTTVGEDDVKANASWMASKLAPSGWQYVTVDMEWFVINPVPEGNAKDSIYSMDAYGRFTPAVNRFPSAKDAGFKPLSDYVHSLGLKFGIHILQGIPKAAVSKNLPIEGSSFTAKDAADTSGVCKWNYDYYNMKNTPAAQAYYDSVARLYASWGVDLIKVDCIAFGPYRGDDIRMLSLALKKTGRPIALSLSPGPAPLAKAGEMRKYSQMWRISNDTWDLWHSNVAYPQGVVDQFPRAAKWASISEPGHWPDADMLPLGYLGPRPGWGKARETRLSHDEQETLLTLWAMMRSPLVVGGDLPHSDDWFVSMLTNKEFIEVDQHSTGNHMVSTTPTRVAWVAHSADKHSDYVAVFNTSASKQKVSLTWAQLGLPSGSHAPRDIWNHADLPASSKLEATLAPHACLLYRITTR